MNDKRFLFDKLNDMIDFFQSKWFQFAKLTRIKSSKLLCIRLWIDQVESSFMKINEEWSRDNEFHLI